MRETDFQWFVDHCYELYEKYGPVYVVIKNQTVLGTYPTCAAGVRETIKTEEIGTFIVQRCGKDASAYTDYIASTNFII